MKRSTGLALIGAACCLSGPAVAGPGGVRINEVRVDQSGTDNDEYFELKGMPGTSLTGLTYLVIGDNPDGNSGILEAVIDLTGASIPADGHFLVVEDTFTILPLVNADLILAGGAPGGLNFENSDNVTHLLVMGFTGMSGDDLDTNNDGTLDTTPWTAVIDAIGLFENGPPFDADDEWFYGAALGFEDVGPDLGQFSPAHVYRCEAAGTWKIGRLDLGSVVESPGALNFGCVVNPPPCGSNVGSCFTTHASASCDDADCCAAVCAIDPFCCEVTWDASCADLANLTCPEGDPCGLPDAGDCFAPHGGLGCDDADCCLTVCNLDPDCCDVAWDEACVTLAIQNCLTKSSEWVINEIHADPAAILGDANDDGIVSSTQDEFVEIVNNSGGAVDITGWSLADGTATRHVFPSGTVVPDQCAVVVFGGGSPSCDLGGAIFQVASTGQLGLNNSGGVGDVVSLFDATASLVTQYAYGAEGDMDQSLVRSPDITGAPPLILHSDPPAFPAPFSPGKRRDGTDFAGCGPPPLDSDDDGVCDAVDNCPDHANPDQADCDNDEVGDVCEIAKGTQDDENRNGIPDDCEKLPTGLRINEIRVDQPVTDNDEYFELKGPAGGLLNALTYIVIGDGSAAQLSGVIEAAVNLAGQIIPADGHFLVSESTISIPGAVPDLVVTMNFENSDNVTHLLVANFTGATGQDLDTNDDGTIDIMPWSSIVDAVGLIETTTPPAAAGDEWAYGASLGYENIGPDQGIFAPGQVYRCETDRTWTIGLFDPFVPEADDTPGLFNEDCSGGPVCVGDLNGDNRVNVTDLLDLLSQWGDCMPCPPTPCTADFNEDCRVNVTDLLELLAAWGDCPTQPTP